MKQGQQISVRCRIVDGTICGGKTFKKNLMFLHPKGNVCVCVFNACKSHPRHGSLLKPSTGRDCSSPSYPLSDYRTAGLESLWQCQRGQLNLSIKPLAVPAHIQLIFALQQRPRCTRAKAISRFLFQFLTELKTVRLQDG